MASDIFSKKLPNLALALIFSGLVFVSPRHSDAESGLPIPRFVSLKNDRVYARAGPGDQYPINWVYLRKGFPVEGVDEFDHWRLIRDVDNVEGWIHSVMLSGKRFAIVLERENLKDQLKLHRKPEPSSAAIAKIQAGAYGKLLDCTKTWCRIQFEPYRGWVRRDQIWGVYPSEKLTR